MNALESLIRAFGLFLGNEAERGEAAQLIDAARAEQAELVQALRAAVDVAEDTRTYASDWDWRYGEYWDGELAKANAELAKWPAPEFSE